MRFAAADVQARLERLVIQRGERPKNSPGWGMVECVKTGELKSRNGREVCRVTAGKTHCAVDYWAVRAFPEFFRPADKRDTSTIAAHRGNLKRAQQDLERGTPTRTATRTKARRRAGALPAPVGARRPAWKL